MIIEKPIDMAIEKCKVFKSAKKCIEFIRDIYNEKDLLFTWSNVELMTSIYYVYIIEFKFCSKFTNDLI